MTPIETVLFDLDGTLLDSVDLIVESYQHTCRSHGIPVPTRATSLAGMGTPLRVALAELVGSPDRMEECLATYRAFNLEHHDRMIRPYPGVVDMLHALHADGLRLGLVTSKVHAGARRGLALAQVESLFDVVIGADDVTYPKPHGEPVTKALALLGMPTASCCFVGDSLHDMYSGTAAGVATVGITWGPFDAAHLAVAQPTWLCESPAALRALVRPGC